MAVTALGHVYTEAEVGIRRNDACLALKFSRVTLVVTSLLVTRVCAFSIPVAAIHLRDTVITVNPERKI
jgi:hypothetical protein